MTQGQSVWDFWYWQAVASLLMLCSGSAKVRVCRLQLPLAIANAVIPRSEFRGTRDRILSRIQDFC